MSRKAKFQHFSKVLKFRLAAHFSTPEPCHAMRTRNGGHAALCPPYGLLAYFVFR